MNLNTIGATKRPKLSLPFGGRPKPGAALTKNASPTLAHDELRRIVAEMID